jgi:hypothetical protein
MKLLEFHFLIMLIVYETIRGSSPNYTLDICTTCSSSQFRETVPLNCPSASRHGHGIPYACGVLTSIGRKCVILSDLKRNALRSGDKCNFFIYCLVTVLTCYLHYSKNLLAIISLINQMLLTFIFCCSQNLIIELKSISCFSTKLVEKKIYINIPSR